jgi:hypothetical protein
MHSTQEFCEEIIVLRIKYREVQVGIKVLISLFHPVRGLYFLPSIWKGKKHPGHLVNPVKI